MTVENIKSVKATNAAASPPVNSAASTTGGKLRVYYDTVTTTGTATTSGSTYMFGPFASNIVPLFGALAGDGTTDLPDVDVGLSYALSDQTIADEDGSFATALDVDGTAFADHVFVNVKNAYAADGAKALWDYHTSLTADPNGQFYIKVSLDADAVAAGALVMYLEYTMPE